MIDLVNQLNGSNGDKEPFIPCPACSELEEIKAIVSDFNTFGNEPTAVTVDLLVSEVKMWRAKDSYERKLKSSLIASTIKKIQEQNDN